VSFMAVPLAFLWAKPILLLGVEDNIWRRGFQCGETALPVYCDAEIGWIATISKPRFRTKR